jgi:outer membrane protein OmpA-like peptidoglycan-associated protein
MTRQALLASTCLSGLLLLLPQHATAEEANSERGTIRLAQSDSTDPRTRPGGQRPQQPQQQPRPPAQTRPPAQSQQPATRQPSIQGQQPQQPAARPPVQPQRPAVQQPAAPQRPAVQGQPPQRSTIQGQQPAQPQRPAVQNSTDPNAPTRTPGRPGQPQRPAQGQQTPQTPQRPAIQGQQPAQPPQQPAQGQTPAQPSVGQGQNATQPPQSGQPQRPAQGRPTGRPTGQPPAAQGRQQPPAAQGQQPAQSQQPSTIQGQQPGQPQQPPAAQGQQPQGTPSPGRQQRPAMQGRPTGQPPASSAGQQTPTPLPQAPTAQGQPRAVPLTAGSASPRPMGASGQPIRGMDQLRRERRETQEGGRTVIREADRVIIRDGDRTIIRHNETDRFRYNARNVTVERRGSDNFTVVERPGGMRIVDVTDGDGRLMRRMRRYPDGREVVIIDNRRRGPSAGLVGGVVAGAVGLAAVGYYVNLPPPVVRIPRERYILESERAQPEDVYQVLIAPPVEPIERAYSLDEVRYSPGLRDRMSRVDIDTVNFSTGSWEVTPDQTNRLTAIADGIKRAIERNPSEVFLIEGHTDAVGNDDDNLSLSDRRAEAVALVLTETFQVPPENLTTQGYGKQFLKVPNDGALRENRRVAVRRITPLLTGDNGNAGQAPN